ncbi:C1 family peptidase [Eisenibacter elegans]|jgi:C1A family cysteine protease|uniref:C1 family peptidase n=1 Tax=Eisenibacter elegans TaxID=997 RepID=UPI0004157A59|nr:C1 family peptidase [Eisenibacter elegans]
MILYLRFIVLFSCILYVGLWQTPAAFSQGCILDEQAYAQVPLKPLMRSGNLPSYASLRAYAPIPKDQGAYGNCVGWTTAYAGRTIMLAYQQNWRDPVLTTQNALSPFFVYEQAKSRVDIDCKEGTLLVHALEELKNVGVVKFSDFAESCGKPITAQDRANAGKFRIQNYHRLFDSRAANASKIAAIKEVLANHKPVLVGLTAIFPSFRNAKGVAVWNPIQGENPNKGSGHAVAIVGYDDHKYGGAFQLMNSWGTTWGEQGFIWVRYQDMATLCFEAYEMTIEKPNLYTMSGNIRFILSAGYDMKAVYKEGYYEMREPYHSGTLFRLQVSNHRPAYVYVIGADAVNKAYKIFPQDAHTTPFLGQDNSTVALPSAEHYVKMDKTIGTDYFCILYSSEPIPIEEVISQMKRFSGTFKERLELALKGRLAPMQSIDYLRNGEIGFYSESDKNTIVPIIVAIKHVD